MTLLRTTPTSTTHVGTHSTPLGQVEPRSRSDTALPLLKGSVAGLQTVTYLCGDHLLRVPSYPLPHPHLTTKRTKPCTIGAMSFAKPPAAC